VACWEENELECACGCAGVLGEETEAATDCAEWFDVVEFGCCLVCCCGCARVEVPSVECVPSACDPLTDAGWAVDGCTGCGSG
jgi:hypothetical protein